MKLKETNNIKHISILCLCVFATFFAIWTFTGKWFWVSQPYNSYVLQAQSWLSGRLDLPENYSHLEIALFEGKYYISFPPFPSYVMLPFVMLGFDNCDGLIALLSALTAAVYAYKILTHFKIDGERAVFFSLLLTVGSNWLFTAQVAWVWFIAQNMAFTLTLMAIYYALKNKAGLSLALWACAVGCRPFQFFCLPVLLYLIYKSSNKKIGELIRQRWSALIPMLVIALSYMMLNYLRFGNPFEFGHNYLPEFVEAQKGQFHISYMFTNLKNLVRLPKISLTGPWEYQAFNGTNMFIISPIFLSATGYFVYALKKKTVPKTPLVIILSMVCVQLLAITAHKTMGGSQFGNRYTNDVLPLVFLAMAMCIGENKSIDKYNLPLLIWGMAVNVIGSVLYYI